MRKRQKRTRKKKSNVGDTMAEEETKEDKEPKKEHRGHHGRGRDKRRQGAKRGT